MSSLVREDPPALELKDVSCGYSEGNVLSNISLRVQKSEIIAIVGHNGAGKSTLLKGICGLLPRFCGTLAIDGVPVFELQTHDLLRLGVVYVPQGKGVFDNLSVRDNLKIGLVRAPSQRERTSRNESVVEMFPLLKGRLKVRAGTLSGGEKQALALAMAFELSPRLLLLDEPSLGLSPGVAREVFNRISDTCAKTGSSLIIVEQRVKDVLSIATRAYVIRAGRITYEGPSETLLLDQEKMKAVFL